MNENMLVMGTVCVTSLLLLIFFWVVVVFSNERKESNWL